MIPQALFSRFLYIFHNFKTTFSTIPLGFVHNVPQKKKRMQENFFRFRTLIPPDPALYKKSHPPARCPFARNLQGAEQRFRQLVAAAADAIAHHFGHGKIQRADHFESTACDLLFRHFLRQETVSVSA